MRQTDIVIAGGGLAGSTAAAMLARAGYAVALVDPHTTYPPDFRAEKIDGTQAKVLRKSGLADAVLRAATLDGESWVARFGRLVEKRPGAGAFTQLKRLVELFQADLRQDSPLVNIGGLLRNTRTKFIQPRCRPQARSATIRCSARRRAGWCRIRSPTVRPSNASAGS